MKTFSPVIHFIHSKHSSLFPCRLWLSQYRKPSSSIQTCRWPRQLLSGKQNHPLRIDMAHQRYTRHLDSKKIISGQDLASQPAQRFRDLKVDYLFFFICSLDFPRRECPPLDQTWNCHLSSLLIDYCHWRPNGASCTHTHPHAYTKLKQDSFQI